MPPEAVMICAIIFFSPAVIVGVVLRHREKMAIIRNRQDGAPGILEEMRSLRSELAALRDTTTRFDMSFDAALNRVEQRLDVVEQDNSTVAPTPAYRTAATTDEPQSVLQARR